MRPAQSEDIQFIYQLSQTDNPLFAIFKNNSIEEITIGVMDKQAQVGRDLKVVIDYWIHERLGQDRMGYASVIHVPTPPGRNPEPWLDIEQIALVDKYESESDYRIMLQFLMLHYKGANFTAKIKSKNTGVKDMLIAEGFEENSINNDFTKNGIVFMERKGLIIDY
jgi:hypothetical protein